MTTRYSFNAQDISNILDCTHHPSILLDKHYNIIAANSAYKKHYHFSDNQPNHCYKVSHGYRVPCDQAGETCPLQKTLATNRAQRVLHIHHTTCGQEHVDVSMLPLHDAEGHIVYFLETMKHLDYAHCNPEQQGLVGQSPAFHRMLELIQRVAPSETSILLLGESGTGKELVAQAAHHASQRSAAAFVPVECSGLSETLFESELFGHEKGAFTGAHSRKKGLVEAAQGGTLFLDEIGDIPLPLQVKLLRLLETGTYRRVGSTEAIQSDFRLICATHRDIKKMVTEGQFRQDLYYRINIFPIHLPALRERPEDLELLAQSLLWRISETSFTLSDSALAILQAHNFPGNIRELRNVLERASLLTDNQIISAEHLPEWQMPLTQLPKHKIHFADIIPLDELECNYLGWVNASFQGDKRNLAKQLGVSERTLYRKLELLKQKFYSHQATETNDDP